jgi:hypothetical protein
MSRLSICVAGHRHLSRVSVQLQGRNWPCSSLPRPAGQRSPTEVSSPCRCTSTSREVLVRSAQMTWLTARLQADDKRWTKAIVIWTAVCGAPSPFFGGTGELTADYEYRGDLLLLCVPRPSLLHSCLGPPSLPASWLRRLLSGAYISYLFCTKYGQWL